MLDTIVHRQSVKFGKVLAPYLEKTVTGVGTGKGGRSLKFDSQSGRAGRQVHHQSQITALQESYLADFLDVPLPTTGKSQLTCRELHRLWCILADAAEILSVKKRAKDLSDFDSALQFSLTMRTSEFERAGIECCGLSAERAAEALKFLSLDGSDTGAMFADGFWSRPILTLSSTESALIAAPLFVGNPIRRAEHWFTRGGFSDNLSNVGRGSTFEASVRAALIKAINKNKLLSDSYCSSDGIKKVGPEGEQIDLLFRIRDLVVVGEVKCLLAPIEATEEANYIRKMREACDQSNRKAEWLSTHRDQLVKALNLSEERANKAPIIPIVVTNQSFGSSLAIGNARLIDFHFLQLYLADGKYVAGAAFRQDTGQSVLQHEVLYENEREGEQKFVVTIENPKPLKKYLDIVKWTETSFPLSNGENLVIETCVMEGNLIKMNEQEIQGLFPK